MTTIQNNETATIRFMTRTVRKAAFAALAVLAVLAGAALATLAISPVDLSATLAAIMDCSSSTYVTVVSIAVLAISHLAGF